MLQIYEAILIPWVILGCITFFVLLKIPAPYGKFTKTNWGPMIPSQLGWFVMEIISPIMFAYLFLAGDMEKNWITWVFFMCWVGHYTNRSIIYPLRQENPAKMPLSIAIFAFTFNIVNGFINGYFLGSVQSYTIDYLTNWNFILGIVLFLIGMKINMQSDTILLKLRSENKGYQIPTGGFFKYVSYPNYFGEILEWTAFALMTWSWAGLSFMIWTMANLVPRAIKGHEWYHQKFDDYPKDRKAIFPFFL
ncbi:MAG: DUF1295 domain-containing protein [Candidatus Neomarinimicrobiota bacterium]|nr:DUF1295 domain-containing protein [Candidatus Neomarinimicrobiota bacterium]